MILYNDASDVLGKAMRGLDLAPSIVESMAKLEPGDLMRLLRGEWNPSTLARVAGILEMDAPALVALESVWQPIPVPEGLSQLVLPFEDEDVNAWLLESEGHRLVIDAGLGKDDLHHALAGTDSFDLLITHPHRDHIGGVDKVLARTNRLIAPTSLHGSETAAPGDRFALGPWSIEVHDLRGHHPDAIGYRIRGGESDFMAVGDAVFARSIGGCPDPTAYQCARKTLSTMWPMLGDETLLLTGHGPLSRVDRERRENPFVAAWL